MKFNTSIFKYKKKQLFIRSVFVLISDILIAFAIVLNKNANLGNDPVAIFYDGIHSTFHLDLGLAANIANITLFIFLLVFSKKYINIGTFLYTFPLGFIISFFNNFIGFLNLPNILILNIFKSTIGCLSLFLGVALFISSNIGVDVWTGFSLFLKDKLNKEFRFVKVIVDVLLVFIGFFMGGEIGIITILSAICGGPLIQKFIKFTDKLILIATNFKGGL